jgi:glycosyltransferase involved in cell wall biosynthesis
MIRVLFIIRRLVQGGAQRQLLELVKRLDKSLFDISVICLYAGGALWDEANSISGVHIDHVGKKGRWNVGSLTRIAAYVRRVRPHIVHGYMDLANVLALVAKPMGARVVWGIRASKVDMSHYDYMRGLVLQLETWLAPFADLIICNSESARAQAIARRFPANRTIVIPNGIDTDRFRPDPISRERVRAGWRVGSNQFLIGSVARFDPMKGQSDFLAAARLVAARHEDVRFVLIGDGPEDYRRGLQEVATREGLQKKLIWAGARSDIAAVFSALDLSVSASLFGEGFSNALAESMACGIPCIATDVGDSAKIVGKLGWLVRPGDPIGLAEQMCSAMQMCLDGRVRSDLLRSHVEREYGTGKLAESTTAALSGLIRRL